MGLLACALLFATATPASLGAQARTLTVDDLRLEVGLSGPELAPDGRRAVVVTSRPDYEENRFGRSLVLVDLATDERRDLILSDTGDERVTVSQSYKLYHALKDNGVEVSFIAYPVPGHFPQDPVHQRDVWRRWVQWIAEHFGRVGVLAR